MLPYFIIRKKDFSKYNIIKIITNHSKSPTTAINDHKTSTWTIPESHIDRANYSPISKYIHRKPSLALFAILPSVLNVAENAHETIQRSTHFHLIVRCTSSVFQIKTC